MNVNQQIKEQLKNYFYDTPTEPISKIEVYRKIANKLGVHPERVRKHHRMMKEKGFTEFMNVQNSHDLTGTYTVSSSFTNNDTGVFTSEVQVDFEPKSDTELAELHKIDLNKYKISSYWSKLLHNGKFTSSINAKLINVDSDLSKQKDLLLAEIKTYSPSVKKNCKEFKGGTKSSNLLEIAIPDIHFGKLSHSEESGEDYDLKIAGKRFTDAVNNIISNVNMDTVERILFPIGNDMFNVDNMQATTTGGTPQDTDTRFHKMVKFVKNILIQEIDKLSSYAPVDVVVVPGNHDEQTAFMLGEILDAFYHNNSAITVDNNPKLRKYYQYYNTSILLTHGDKEKHSNLGMIFAAEHPSLWANTKYRFIQLGHFHHNKKINYLANDEFQGFQIQVLPSLSPNDKWHYGKGFLSLKQAKGFLFNASSGLVAEYTFTI